MNEISPQVVTFITLLIGLLISGAVPVITVAFYRWIAARATEIQARLSADQIAQFRSLVAMAIMAAEQSGLAGLIQNIGTEKKRLATDTLQAIVDARGWHIPIQQIESEIEAAIAQGLESAKTLTPPPALDSTMPIMPRPVLINPTVDESSLGG